MDEQLLIKVNEVISSTDFGEVISCHQHHQSAMFVGFTSPLTWHPLEGVQTHV
jgi:hypothetical protein